MVISAATLLSRAYAGNTGFKDENYRKHSLNHDVVSADRKAMERALDRLGSVDYESEDDEDRDSVYETVKAYLDVYNNAVDSAHGSADTDIQRTAKGMKDLMKKYAGKLEEIGVTLGSDGKARINKTELSAATSQQMSRIFGDEEYTGQMKRLMKKLRDQVNRDTSAQQSQAASRTAGGEAAGANLDVSV